MRELDFVESFLTFYYLSTMLTNQDPELQASVLSKVSLLSIHKDTMEPLNLSMMDHTAKENPIRFVLGELRSRITALDVRLDKDSHNSSGPPASCERQAGGSTLRSSRRSPAVSEPLMGQPSSARFELVWKQYASSASICCRPWTRFFKGEPRSLPGVTVPLVNTCEQRFD